MLPSTITADLISVNATVFSAYSNSLATDGKLTVYPNHSNGDIAYTITIDLPEVASLLDMSMDLSVDTGYTTVPSFDITYDIVISIVPSNTTTKYEVGRFTSDPSNIESVPALATHEIYTLYSGALGISYDSITQLAIDVTLNTTLTNEDPGITLVLDSSNQGLIYPAVVTNYNTPIVDNYGISINDRIYGFELFNKNGKSIYNTTNVTWLIIDTIHVPSGTTFTKSYNKFEFLEMTTVTCLINAAPNNQEGYTPNIEILGKSISIGGNTSTMDAYVYVMVR